MADRLLSAAVALILCSWLVLFASHLTVMPIFPRRLKRHDRGAHETLNVAWLRIFLKFRIAAVFFFIMRRDFMRYPVDMHKPGKILVYTWAYPLLISALGVLGLLAYALVTGRRLA